MTRAHAKALQEKVTSLLSNLQLGTPLDGMLLTADTLCVIRYIPQESPPWSQTIDVETRREEEKAAAPADSGTTAQDERYYCYGGTTKPQEPARPSAEVFGKSTCKSGTTAP